LAILYRTSEEKSVAGVEHNTRSKSSQAARFRAGWLGEDTAHDTDADGTIRSTPRGHRLQSRGHAHAGRGAAAGDARTRRPVRRGVPRHAAAGVRAGGRAGARVERRDRFGRGPVPGEGFGAGPGPHGRTPRQGKARGRSAGGSARAAGGLRASTDPSGGPPRGGPPGAEKGFGELRSQKPGHRAGRQRASAAGGRSNERRKGQHP